MLLYGKVTLEGALGAGFPVPGLARGAPMPFGSFIPWKGSQGSAG